MQLNNESLTLFIPLLAKAQMSKKGLFLEDKKAEEIVSNLFNTKKVKQNKYLNMFLSLRAKIIDELCNNYLTNNPNTTVIHLGCGLDSRCLRVKQNYSFWYDVDFENVIKIRKSFYRNSDKYCMVGSSVTDAKWLNKIKTSENVLVVVEGLTMYLSEDEIKDLFFNLGNKFKNFYLIFDAYSKKAVKLSKIKNPVNKVNAKVKFGMDSFEDLIKLNENLNFINQHFIKKKENNLKGLHKFLFNNLYCGKTSQKLYKIYEFSFCGK